MSGRGELPRVRRLRVSLTNCNSLLMMVAVSLLPAFSVRCVSVPW